MVKTTQSFFDSVAHSWDANYVPRSLFAQRMHILDRLIGNGEMKDQTALDIGCGTGMASLLVARRGACVHGIDISERMVERARAAAAAEGLPGLFEVSDASCLRASDASFDLVTCVSVLEWVDNDADVIRQIIRVLKPGGRCIVSVPNRSSLLRRCEMAVFRVRSMLERFVSLSPGYLMLQKRQYTLSELLERFTPMRLQNVVFYAGPFERNSYVQAAMHHRLLGMMLFASLTKP